MNVRFLFLFVSNDFFCNFDADFSGDTQLVR